MDFIKRNFEPIILKAINNKVFSTIKVDIDLIDKCTSKETFNNLFNIIQIQEMTYFCHIVPIHSNQAIVILLRQKNHKNLTTNILLSYRVANITLQRFESIKFHYSNCIKREIICDHLTKNIKNSIHKVFSSEKMSPSNSEFMYIRPVAASCTSETIGHLLGKSHRTCEDRIKSLYKKFECQSRRELTEVCNHIILISQEYILIPNSGYQINT